MLVIAIMLAICSLVIEFLVASKSLRLRRCIAKSTLANMCFSLFVSWLLGAIFGASGVTVLTAAMLATASSVGIYRVLNGATHTKDYFNVKYRS